MFHIDALRRCSFAALVLVVNPASTWKPSESIEQVTTLRIARAAHTATTLRSGEVLVVAGMTSEGGSLAEAELFNPADNTIRQLGRLAEPRAGHTATLLTDGRVLIAGGYNGEYLASVELFDPSALRFRSGGSLLEGRSGRTSNPDLRHCASSDANR